MIIVSGLVLFKLQLVDDIPVVVNTECELLLLLEWLGSIRIRIFRRNYLAILGLCTDTVEMVTNNVVNLYLILSKLILCKF